MAHSYHMRRLVDFELVNAGGFVIRQPGNFAPNIGRPLLDCSREASS